MDTRQRQSSIEKVRIDTLTLPAVGKAQRPFHPAKGDRFAREFDINLFGFPVVCRAEGVNWLVDGQHRVYGVQKSGFAQPTDEIECEVYRELPLSDMAAMFLGRNRGTPVTAFERFGVAVTAGYPAEVAIAGIVDSLDLKIAKIAKSTDRGHVFAVGALRRVFDRDGAQVLARVLRVLRDAYESESAAFGRTLIDGLGMVLAAYDTLDDELLVKALGALPHRVHSVETRARQLRLTLDRPVPECVAAVVVDVYNAAVAKKRRLVKWWKLDRTGTFRRASRSRSS